SGLFSKNSLSEDLIGPLLKVVLNSPRLRNANAGQLNVPGIDLVDSHSRVAIQVTTEVAAEKVTETCQMFLERGYHKKYRRLVMFQLTNTVPRYRAVTRQRWKRLYGRKLRFDPSRDILPLPRVLDLIRHLPPKDIFKIEELLARSIVGERFI